MIDWVKVFGTSDYDEKDPSALQNTALAHARIGAVFAAVWLLFTWDLSLILAGQLTIYTLKELFFDLRRIIQKKPTKWKKPDLLTVIDSLVDLVFWMMGSMFTLYLVQVKVLEAVVVGLGSTIASFSYFKMR